MVINNNKHTSFEKEAQIHALKRPFTCFKNNDTVNWEIFGRVLFLPNFKYVKFCEIKTLAKWQNHSVVY